jgi:DNA-binding NarL/FixJ family response regulator
MYTDRRFVKGMMDAGASGYMLKSSTPDELMVAIHATDDRFCTCPRITAVLAEYDT